MFSSKMENLRDQISIEEGENQVVIRLMGESTFDSGKTEIRPELKPLLKKVAGILQSGEGDIIVAGHTDNVPIRNGGPYRTNLRLSAARASAVAEFLLSHSSIDPKRISTMGFGEYRPHRTQQHPGRPAQKSQGRNYYRKPAPARRQRAHPVDTDLLFVADRP